MFEKAIEFIKGDLTLETSLTYLVEADQYADDDVSKIGVCVKKKIALALVSVDADAFSTALPPHLAAEVIAAVPEGLYDSLFLSAFAASYVRRLKQHLSSISRPSYDRTVPAATVDCIA